MEIELKKDTVHLNHKLKYDVKIILPENDLYRAFIGDFDSNFTKNSPDEVVKIDLSKENYFQPDKIGYDTLRIWIHNMHFSDNNGSIDTIYRFFFLEKAFYVIDIN